MSHVVEIETEVRDAAAIGAACRRLGLSEPVYGEAILFSGARTGWQIQLPDWRYPAVADISAGRIHFDNYNGHWGERKELDRFLQAYAVERAKSEARKAGYSVTEQQALAGNIKVEIHVGGTA